MTPTITMRPIGVVVLLAVVCSVVYTADQQQEPTEEYKVRYDGAQVLRVTGVSDENKHKLVELEEQDVLQRWGGNVSAIDVFVSPDNVNKTTDALKKLRFRFNILIDNVQDAIDAENPPLSEDDVDEPVGRSERRITFQHYHQMDDIHGFLDYLEQTYPNLVSTQVIGTSVENRPLKIIKISSDQPTGKAIWIDGGIHAREWISPASVSYIISELVENRQAHLPTIQGIDFYILPLVNPDGYEYSHRTERLWRKNRSNHFGFRGTDLNRNWGFMWGGTGVSKKPWKETYGGPRAFSEPETRAIASFIYGHSQQIKAFVSFHSYGQYILYPWGYEPRLPPDSADLNRVGISAANDMRHIGGMHYTVGSSGTTLYPASGCADDWAKGRAGIKYAYTIELRDKGHYGFLLPSSYIIPTGREALAAVKAIAREVQSTS